MKLSHKVSNVSTVSNVSGVLSKTKLVNIESNHFINDLTHPTHFTHNTHLKRTGFTLAEVLITLGIIGVVAAITMPILITNINERRNSERQANIAQKVTQAMEHMRALGKLTQYESTEAFVNELKNHLKISKICDKDHLTDCWPTATITDRNGKEYNVADAKTGRKIFINTTTNNVGLILADGASIILNYNNKNKGLDIGDRVTASTKSLPVGTNKSKDFPYTTSVTNSIDFIMDVNGKGNPNREMDTNNRYYDIRSFKAAGFSKPIENGGAGKILYIGTFYDPVDCGESNSSSQDYQDYCGDNPSGFGNDYWAGAQKACVDLGGRLPDISKLQQIYAKRSEYPSLNGFYLSTLWSNQEYSWHPYEIGAYISFDYAEITSGTEGGTGKAANNDVVCVMD